MLAKNVGNECKSKFKSEKKIYIFCENKELYQRNDHPNTLTDEDLGGRERPSGAGVKV